LTLREEHRLRVFENRVLRRIFGPKRDEVTGEWRKLHNEELQNLYSSPNIIRTIKSRRMRWAGHVARMGEKRNSYRILVEKPEGRRPLGRPRRRWMDNIKMDFPWLGSIPSVCNNLLVFTIPFIGKTLSFCAETKVAEQQDDTTLHTRNPHTKP
jgi:hypothetical protein